MKAKKTLLKILTVLLLAACVFALYSCNDEPEAEYTVSYMVDGEVYHTQTVKSVDEIQIPENPSKEGYTFDGWYLDNLTWEEDFTITVKITEDIKLYAKFSEIKGGEEGGSGDNGGNTDNGGNNSGNNGNGDNTGSGDNGDNTETHTHSLSHFDAKSATCTESGNVEYWSCSSCGKSFLDANASVEAASVTVPAAHSLTHHEAVAASCTAEGVIEYWSCSACTKNFSDSAATTEAATLAVAKAAHTLTHCEETESSCAVAGVVEHWLCTVCEKTFSDENASAELEETQKEKTAHYMTHSPAEAATCTEDGYAEYWYCSLCEKRYSDAEGESELTTLIISKTGHSLTHHAAVSATCTASGTIEYWSCSVCNKNFSDANGVNLVSNLATAIISHSYGEDGKCTVCGNYAYTEGLSYTLINDGTAYEVSGIGTATDTDIVIPEKYKDIPVVSIGDYAFKDCTNLKSITIPQGVQSICYCAFLGCSNLREVEISENSQLESIGSGAFFGCRSLESITIPKSVTYIGSQSFSACNALANVTVENGNITYHSNGNCIIETESETLIIGCKNSTIPNDGSVTSIGDFAFYSCTSLTSITIPDSITSIVSFAFSGCTSLNAVYISDIESWLNISFGSDANPLYNEANLYLNGTLVTELTIPSTVKKINDYAFRGCTSIESVIFEDNSLLKSIGSHAFRDCTSLTSITIPDSITSIVSFAFSGCTSLNAVHISDIESWLNISFGGYEANPLYYANNLYLSGALVTELTIPSTVTKINAYAFDGCTSLESITIPSSVHSISEYAFGLCSNLKEVEFTEDSQLESIGEYAFLSTSLYSITIPESVTSISDNAFYNCVKLVEVYNKSSLTITKGSYLNGSVGYYALNVYTEEGGSKLETVGDYIFCSDGTDNYLVNYVGNETNLVLPESYKGGSYKINKYAFYNNRNIISITIPESLTSISDNAFYNCVKLVEVYNKSSLTITKGSYLNGSVGYYALNVYTEEGGSKLETTSDGFVFCSDGTDNYLVNYVGNETNILLPESYKGGNYKINQYAFYGNTDIISVTIPESLTCISDNAFNDCTSLESITISDSVQSIGDYAFEGCSNLKEVNFAENSQLSSIGYSAFLGCTSLKTVSFGENSLLESIGVLAFQGCTSLTNITVPESVTSIGAYAFEDCTSLKTVSFGDNSQLESIDVRAFYYCTRLESISIPESVTSIGSSAFEDCTSLTSITFTDTSTWYRTTNADYTDGTETDVTVPENNAAYFTSTYLNYYWYKE